MGKKTHPIRRNLIVEVWKKTGKDSVGAAEIDLIQKALLKKFGGSASESPAAIARVLAENRARLLHPQILEADVRWRKRHLYSLFAPEELSFANLTAALESVEKLDALYQQLEHDRDYEGLRHLRGHALQIKRELKLVAESKRAAGESQQLAKEVVQWFTIWLQTPQIFADWLSLLRGSAGFRQHFDP